MNKVEWLLRIRQQLSLDFDAPFEPLGDVVNDLAIDITLPDQRPTTVSETRYPDPSMLLTTPNATGSGPELTNA